MHSSSETEMSQVLTDEALEDVSLLSKSKTIMESLLERFEQGSKILVSRA